MNKSNLEWIGTSQVLLFLFPASLYPSLLLLKRERKTIDSVSKHNAGIHEKKLEMELIFWHSRSAAFSQDTNAINQRLCLVALWGASLTPFICSSSLYVICFVDYLNVSYQWLTNCIFYNDTHCFIKFFNKLKDKQWNHYSCFSDNYIENHTGSFNHSISDIQPRLKTGLD